MWSSANFDGKLGMQELQIHQSMWHGLFLLILFRLLGNMKKYIEKDISMNKSTINKIMTRVTYHSEGSLLNSNQPPLIFTMNRTIHTGANSIRKCNWSDTLQRIHISRLLKENQYYGVPLFCNSPKLFIFFISSYLLKEKFVRARIVLKWIISPTYFSELKNLAYCIGTTL